MEEITEPVLLASENVMSGLTAGLNAEQVLVAMAVIAFLPKLLWWAWGRIWQNKDKAEETVEAQRQAKLDRLDNAIVELRQVFENGVDDLRDLLNAHHGNIIALQTSAQFTKERLERLESKVDAHWKADGAASR